MGKHSQGGKSRVKIEIGGRSAAEILRELARRLAETPVLADSVPPEEAEARPAFALFVSEGVRFGDGAPREFVAPRKPKKSKRGAVPEEPDPGELIGDTRCDCAWEIGAPGLAPVAAGALPGPAYGPGFVGRAGPGPIYEAIVATGLGQPPPGVDVKFEIGGSLTLKIGLACKGDATDCRGNARVTGVFAASASRRGTAAVNKFIERDLFTTLELAAAARFSVDGVTVFEEGAVYSKPSRKKVEGIKVGPGPGKAVAVDPSTDTFPLDARGTVDKDVRPGGGIEATLDSGARIAATLTDPDERADLDRPAIAIYGALRGLSAGVPSASFLLISTAKPSNDALQPAPVAKLQKRALAELRKLGVPLPDKKVATFG